MGCAPSDAFAPGDDVGGTEIILSVPDMPNLGGPTGATTPDGIKLEFFVPAGYEKNTKVKTRYQAMPKPKAVPKPKVQAKPKAKAKAKPGDPAPPTVAVVAEPVPVVAEVLGPLPPNPQKVEVKIVYPVDSRPGGWPILPTQLPKMEGSWDWIRHANDEVHRVTRLDAGECLQEAFKKGGFCVQQGKGPSQLVKLVNIPKMVAGTKMLSFSQGLPKLGKAPGVPMELEYGQGITPIEKAQAMQTAGFKVATVNAASAYHAGGGFTSGGRHALEEAFCSQSTLYKSLEKAMDLWKLGERQGIYRSDNASHHQHIPTDGCIMSPFVEIIRGNTDQGYFANTKAVPVAAVVSVAMYNKNTHVRDAPTDAPTDPKLYEEGVRKKFTTMLHAAALSGANAIIIPDVGCGVFQNDPTVCGRILGEALFNYSKYFKRAVFTGKEAFYTAASEAIKTASTSGVKPITADISKRSCMMPLDAKAHLLIGRCVVCKRGLACADFTSLVVLVDKTKKSHQMQFLHDDCCDTAHKEFPKHQPMKLPDITQNPASFLKALDLNANGFVEKQELKCIAALFWDGDLSNKATEMEFEKDFEARFQSWDADKSGNVDKEQITTVAKTQSKPAEPPKFADPTNPARNSLCLDAVPKTCIRWFQEEAGKQRKAK